MRQIVSHRTQTSFCMCMRMCTWNTWDFSQQKWHFAFILVHEHIQPTNQPTKLTFHILFSFYVNKVVFIFSMQIIIWSLFVCFFFCLLFLFLFHFLYSLMSPFSFNIVAVCQFFDCRLLTIDGGTVVTLLLFQLSKIKDIRDIHAWVRPKSNRRNISGLLLMFCKNHMKREIDNTDRHTMRISHTHQLIPTE